ncbi:MAG: C25 family cysteine peptidase [Chloroflexota bacterium]
MKSNTFSPPIRFLALSLVVLASLIHSLFTPSTVLSQAETTTAKIVSADSLSTDALTPTFWTPPDPAYRIDVTADGVHQLDYTYLQAAGLPVDTLDPRTFQMFYLGSEIAIEVAGESDGRFDAGDRITFYGRSIDGLYAEGKLTHHKYTGKNVYWLTYDLSGLTVGKRMAPKDGSIAGGATPAVPYLVQQRIEQQIGYASDVPKYGNSTFLATDDRWIWKKMQFFTFSSSSAKTFSANFEATNLVTTGYTATVTAHLIGGSTINHGARILVNGTQVVEDTTTGRRFEAFDISASFPQTLLVEGTNTIAIEFLVLSGFYDIVYVDWLEVNYYRTHAATNNALDFEGEVSSGVNPGPWHYTLTNFDSTDIHLYDVTDMYNTQDISNLTINSLIAASVNDSVYDTVHDTVHDAAAINATVDFGDSASGRRYIAWTPDSLLTPNGITLVTQLTTPATPSYTPDDLLDTANGADWIVITHEDFWDEVYPLAVHRDTNYRVAIVHTQKIYDQFNGGMLSSESINDFLTYAYQNWQAPAPQFVLLAGGGTSDMRQYISGVKTTYVPTFMYPADPILGDTASDNRFVMITEGDILPDMHIGRFPAYNEADLTTMVEKTIRYETTPTFNDWNRNVLFVSDDLEGGGGNFYNFSDILADGYAEHDPTLKLLPDPYTSTKVYLGRTCDLGNPSTATECQDEIIDTINNDGALIVSYVGHALTTKWGSESLMNETVISRMTNSNQLSIFLAMACFEGFFHTPGAGAKSLAERYMTHPNAAVASWSPTGFGVATGHDWLEQGLFISLFDDEVTELGKAMTEAKYYMDDHAPAHKYDDLIDTFLLLGDPALVVQRSVAPTAVDMAGFTAYMPGDTAQNDSGQDAPATVMVEWHTGSEIEILGFNLLRAEGGSDDFSQINAEMIFANNAGMSGGSSYAYEDIIRESQTQQYQYKLEVVKLDGTSERYGLADVNFGPQVGDTQQVFLPFVVR